MKNSDDFKNPPELTPEQLEQVRSEFLNYIFYRRTTINKPNFCGDNVRVKTCECTCSACGRTYFHDFDGHKNGDKVTCPECGATAIFRSNGYSKNSLEEYRRILIVCPENENKVWLRAYYVVRKFSEDSFGRPVTDLKMYEETRYILTPRSARCAKYYYYCYQDKIVESIEERKNIIEPFFSYMGNIPIYLVLDTQDFQNTFLKYIDIGAYENRLLIPQCHLGSYYRTIFDFKLAKYICAFAQYPIVEKLMKAGFENIVIEMVIYNKPCKRIFNWNADTLEEFFKKFDCAEIKYLRGFSQQTMFAQDYAEYKKIAKRPDIRSIDLIIAKYGQDTFLDLCKFAKQYGLTFEKTHGYIDRQLDKLNRQAKKDKKKIRHYDYKSCFTLWRDYLNFAHDLSFNLADPVVMFPKDIKISHDSAAKLASDIKRESEENAMRELTERLKKKYSFRYGDLVIKVPESMQEIIREGQELCHCVGGYAARHAEGKVIILFVRKTSLPETPYVTVELTADGKKIVQYRGYRNDVVIPLPEEVHEFINEFKAYIAHPKAYMKKLAALEKQKAIA